MRASWLIAAAAACGDSGSPPMSPSPRDQTSAGGDAATQPTPPKPAAPRACFAPVVEHPYAGDVMPLVAADFNADKRLDLLMHYSDWDDIDKELLIPLRFNAGTPSGINRELDVDIGEMSISFAAGDFDRDSNVDAVVAEYRDKRLAILSGIGDGNLLRAKRTVRTPRKPNGVEAGDLNGDLYLDLVVTYFKHIQVFFGDGKLGFRAGKLIETDQAPDGPVVGDIDGDGDADVVVAANDVNLFVTYVNDGKGSLSIGERTPTCTSPGYLFGGDLDGDGDLDVSYMCDDGGELRHNDGKGKFVARRRKSKPTHVVAGDFTHDGVADIMTFTMELDSCAIELHRGTGGGTFEILERLTVDGQIQSTPLVGDFDGDTHDDVTFGLWRGRPPGILAILPSRDCP
jgi:hypothetical protein